MSPRVLPATQTSSTLLHGTSKKIGPEATQETQSQAANMPDWDPRDSTDRWQGSRDKEARRDLPLLHLIQTSNTLLFHTSIEPETRNTQNLQSQAACMSDAAARASKGIWEGQGRDTETRSESL